MEHVTARVVCESVTRSVGVETPRLRPITNGHPQNNNYSRYTPSGLIELTITNEALLGHFQPGVVYDVLISRVASE